MTGREAELAELTPAARRKKVVVVGGGPAGLEAARVAALRGHEVVLYEKGTRLGGQVLIAARAPFRPGYESSVDWLARQLAKTPTKVHLGVEATVEMIPAEAPDAVIVATGAVPRRPDVPGVDLPGVATVEDILLGSVPGGPRCLVLDGTGHVQAGLAADLLARQGHTVTVAAPYHTVCDNVEPSTKEPLLERLYQGNVTLVPDAILTAIEQDETAGGFRSWFANEYSGRRFAIDGVDTVVLAYGGRAVNDLYARLKGRVPELRLVGDAMAPRSLHDALLEGTRAARQL